MSASDEFDKRLSKVGLKPQECVCLLDYIESAAKLKNDSADRLLNEVITLFEADAKQGFNVRITQRKYFEDLTERVQGMLACKKNSNEPLQRIENVLKVMRQDPYFSDVYYNELTNETVHKDGKNLKVFTDTDDAMSMHFLEEIYELNNKDKYNNALRIFCKERSFNPIRDRIEQLEWDGKKRVSECFIKWLGLPDNEYSRDVSRVFFAQGIKRAYEPGCKAEHILALEGAQGRGKSTFCRLLSLDETLYLSLEGIKTKDDLQTLLGKWIVEIEEMTAFHGCTNDQKKHFLSGQNDEFRNPYDKRKSNHFRTCVFISTTNEMQFLNDLTGERRWMPVHTNIQGLFGSEKNCTDYIMQCWAEMREAYKKNSTFANPYPNPELKPLYEAAQQEFTVDDSDSGLILQYLIDHQEIKEIPVVWLWRDALGNSGNPDSGSARKIGKILRAFNWTVCEAPANKTFYLNGESLGRQRFYVRPTFDEKTADLENEHCPF